MPKIAIGMPTNRLIKSKTAASVMKIVAYTENEVEIIVSTRGYNTSENRNWIAAQACKRGCDYLFFIDDDMILPEDTLDRLLEHKKDIVGGVYLTKYEVQDYVYELLPDKKPKVDDIFEVAAIGTGAMLIKCDVFRKLPIPWFKYEWEGGMVKRSHDWIFCEDARNAGIKVWADPTLDIKHIGQYEY